LRSANLQATIQAAGFLQVPPKSPFKKLLLGTGLWRYTYVKMSTNLKSTDTLKDTECEKGQLSQRPPIPYVPVVDVVTPKKDPAVLKVKLPNDSHISIPIFSRGNNEEYIAHIVAVLRIIKQKGLPKKCRVYAKAVAKQQEALKILQEALESRDTILTSVDVTACKVEIEQTTQMLQESQRAHNKAIAKLYEQLRNLLSGDPVSQWDRICRKMHKNDSWAAVNGKITKGKRLQMWMSFLDCLELHKLTVFSADAAEKQGFYIQQAVCKPQRATVRQHISRMGVLNDYVRHLPTLKDSSKAVPTTKKGNIPFGEAYLVSRHSAVFCPDVVAESVQSQSLDGSPVHTYVVTGPGSYQASDGRKARCKPQSEGKGRYSPSQSQE
jgi:hypothetical protein